MRITKMSIEQTIKKDDYELIVWKYQDREEYNIEILENGKPITDKIYNYYKKNHKKYIDNIANSNCSGIRINTKEYEKILYEILEKYDTRDTKKELIDNTEDMLWEIDEALEGCYDSHFMDLTKEQKKELNKIIKTNIRNYINELGK